jgi:hypothetical protein
MPERAEIEAAAEALRDTYVALGTRSGLFGSVGLLDERSRIRIAEVILDRVRDARGDDEDRFDDAGRRRYPKMLHGEAATAARLAEHARSPQGEDHEAPEFDEQAITDILVAIDDTLWGCGRERMDIIDGPTVDALRDAVKRELVAFVARAGESNEGGNQNDERRH